MTAEITLSELVVTELEQFGLLDAFIVTGGAIAGFTEALAKSKLIKSHYMLSEQSASIAAEAYGHYDGLPALLVTTSGPGVTNALTGVAAAWTNSTPMIVISGQARSMDVIESRLRKNRQVGNQHVNTLSLVSAITKLSIEPVDQFDATKVIKDLYMTSTNGRNGPVWLSFPSDIQRKRVTMNPKRYEANTPVAVSENNNSIFEREILGLFSDSKKPAVLIGNGARKKGKLPPEIYEFLVQNELPVVTTWPGLDLIPEKFYLNYGRPGTIASSHVSNYLIQECDSLLIIGARLDLAQIGFRPTDFAKQARVLRLDIDEEEFLRIDSRQNWVNYCGSVDETLEVFKKVKRITTGHKNWIDVLDQKKEVYLNRGIEELSDGVSTYKVVQALGQLGIKNVVCGSSGTCVEMVLQTWPTETNQRFIFSCGLGSMGFGLAAAIGIALKTSKQILLLESDGSLAMNIHDFETISRLGLNIKIVILNSGGYKSIRLSQNRQNQYPHGTDVDTGVFLPDPTKWGLAASIDAMDVYSSAEISESVAWLFKSNLPKILNVHVSPTEEAFPRLLSKVNQNGIMETSDYVDLWPGIN